jgi:hypothetical protein
MLLSSFSFVAGRAQKVGKGQLGMGIAASFAVTRDRRQFEGEGGRMGESVDASMVLASKPSLTQARRA